MIKKREFFAIRFRWNYIKRLFFHSSKTLLRSSIFFTNRFRQWNNSEPLQNFVARIDCLKISTFSQTDSVYEIIWNKLNFQSLNKSFKNYNLFANPFIAPDILNSFRFKTWFYWIKNVNFSQSVSVNDITWIISKFQKSNSVLKQFNDLVTDCIYEITLKNQIFKAWRNHLKIIIFLLTHSLHEITWTLSD